MGKFRQFLTQLAARVTSGFSFPDDNLINIFTALSVALILWRSGLGLLMANIRLILTEVPWRGIIVSRFFFYCLHF